jgi:hypothetical protein
MPTSEASFEIKPTNFFERNPILKMEPNHWEICELFELPPLVHRGQIIHGSHTNCVHMYNLLLNGKICTFSLNSESYRWSSPFRSPSVQISWHSIQCKLHIQGQALAVVLEMSQTSKVFAVAPDIFFSGGLSLELILCQLSSCWFRITFTTCKTDDVSNTWFVIVLQSNFLLSLMLSRSHVKSQSGLTGICFHKSPFIEYYIK